MLFADGATGPARRFIPPGSEAAIAFLMLADLSGAQGTRHHQITATGPVAATLEIPDTRVRRADPATGTPRKTFDTVADIAVNAGILPG